MNLSSILEECPAQLTGADIYSLCSDAMMCAVKRKVEWIEEGRSPALPHPMCWSCPAQGQRAVSTAIAVAGLGGKSPDGAGPSLSARLWVASRCFRHMTAPCVARGERQFSFPFPIWKKGWRHYWLPLCFAFRFFSFFLTQGWIQRALLSYSPWKTSCRLLRGCSHQSLSRSSSGTNSSSRSLLPANKAQARWDWRSKGTMC